MLPAITLDGIGAFGAFLTLAAAGTVYLASVFATLLL